MIPTPLPGPRDAPWTHSQLCSVAQKWGVQTELVMRLLTAANQLPFGVSIISGARSRAHQEQLEREGRPAAPFDLSTHAAETADGCPRLATGIDVRLSVAPVNAVKAQFGAAATFAGLRWGGGSPIDPETGIPSDWNHVDLGPRSTHP